MNFIVEFVVWLLEIWPGLEIHKVDLFIFVGAGMALYTIIGLSEFGAKQLISMVGYTMMLNTLGVLFGTAPAFWWAWGWTFAFIPVFNWWKPMILILTSTVILMFVMYNNGYDKELDKYGAQGFTVPNGCLNWPCTEFSPYYTSYARTRAREAEEKAAKAAARAKPTPPPAPKPEPVKPEVPSYMPRQMFIPVQ